MAIGTFQAPVNEIGNEAQQSIGLLGMRPDYSQDTNLETYNKNFGTQVQNAEGVQNLSLRDKQFNLQKQEAEQRMQMGNLLYQGQITTNALHSNALTEAQMKLGYMQNLPNVTTDIQAKLNAIPLDDPMAAYKKAQIVADAKAAHPDPSTHQALDNLFATDGSLLKSYQETNQAKDTANVIAAARTGDIDPQIASAVQAGQFDPAAASAQANQARAIKQAKAAGIDPNTLMFQDDGSLQPESEIALQSAIAKRAAAIEAAKAGAIEKAKAEAQLPSKLLENQARYGALANIRMTETERKSAENVVSNYKGMIQKGIPLTDDERQEYETNLARLSAIGQGTPNATLKPVATQQERDLSIALQSQQKALDSMSANYAADKDEKGNGLGMFNSKAAMAQRVVQQQQKVNALTSRLSSIRGQAAPPAGGVTAPQQTTQQSTPQPVSRANLPPTLQNQPKGAIIHLKDGTTYQVAD